MNQEYYIGTTNFNHDFNISNRNASDILPSDDLLSSHPLLTDENIDKKLTSSITTEISEEIIIISTKDRNIFSEQLFDFSLYFNSPSGKFINKEVYYNNPTIPQSIEEREKGILGKENTSGWRDEYNNIYPPYNSMNDKGDIITYDSIKDISDNKIRVSANINNLVSIKLIKAIIPNNYFRDRTTPINSIKQYTKYLRCDITPLENNYSSNDIFINNSTEILINIPTSHLGLEYQPINKYTKEFNPPRNGLNIFNIKIRPEGYKTNLEEDQKDIFNRLYGNDTITLLKMDFFKSVIRLHTTYFDTTYWKAGMLIELSDIMKNLIQNTHTSYSILKSIDTYFKSNTSIICLVGLTNEDNKFTSDKRIGNTIFISQFYKAIDNYSDFVQLEYLDDLQDIMTLEDMEILKYNFISYIDTFYLFTKLAEDTLYIKTLTLYFREDIPFSINNDSTIIMNLTLQGLYVFKINYLNPIIDFNIINT